MPYYNIGTKLLCAHARISFRKILKRGRNCSRWDSKDPACTVYVAPHSHSIPIGMMHPAKVVHHVMPQDHDIHAVPEDVLLAVQTNMSGSKIVFDIYC